MPRARFETLPDGIVSEIKNNNNNENENHNKMKKQVND
jgi:hypothetical protein